MTACAVLSRSATCCTRPSSFTRAPAIAASVSGAVGSPCSRWAATSWSIRSSAWRVAAKSDSTEAVRVELTRVWMTSSFSLVASPWCRILSICGRITPRDVRSRARADITLAQAVMTPAPDDWATAR
jgi:hypothetical protein